MSIKEIIEQATSAGVSRPEVILREPEIGPEDLKCCVLIGREAVIRGADLRGSDLSRLESARLIGCVLRRTDLPNDVVLQDCTLED